MATLDISCFTFPGYGHHPFSHTLSECRTFQLGGIVKSSSFRKHRLFAEAPFIKLSARARVVEEGAVAAEEQVSSNTELKKFLEELKPVGRVRIIVNTGVGVLESVTDLEKLFYHTLPDRGEYANLMKKEENVDFHLLISRVKTVKLVKGKSMRGDIPTYTIRFVDDDGKTAASFLVMWKADTNGEYDPGQVEAFEQLMEKYGEEVNF